MGEPVVTVGLPGAGIEARSSRDRSRSSAPVAVASSAPSRALRSLETRKRRAADAVGGR